VVSKAKWSITKGYPFKTLAKPTTDSANTTINKMKPEIQQLMIKYTQKGDDASNGEPQVLEVSTEDNGAGIYYVLKTKRWAIDDIDELVEILTDFKNRTINKI